MPPASRTKLVTKDFQRTTLGAGRRLVVRATAEAMFSPDGEVRPERLDAVVDDLDGFISPASKTLRFGLMLMISALRWSPLLFFRLTAFEQLPVDERVRHLERLEQSKLKQLPLMVVALKTMLTIIFYEDEDEQRAIGYPGSERKRWKKTLPLSAESRTSIAEPAERAPERVSA